jgi:hypothetical protein
VIGDDTLQVFFQVGHFAKQFRRVRLGVPDLLFSGILGEADKEALQGYVVATSRVLRYATRSADLQEGDLLLVGSDQYQVMRQPELVNDGLESEARLTTVVS